MNCSYCGEEVDEAAEYFGVTHHKPWDDSKQERIFCSYECVRGYLHAQHFQILRQDGPPDA